MAQADVKCRENAAVWPRTEAGYRADTAAGKDALLVCDTTEMADALNRRLHDDTVDADAPTVTAARGHRIGVGDLIISRRNDPTIGVYDATDITQTADPVRNGNRWRVYAVDTDHDTAIAARRLDDGARAAFSGDYLREHITHGYAVTVHSAQGVTADATHAVLGENTSRALLYVAMTRGRDTNNAYLYERIAGEGDHEHAQPPHGCTWPRRGTSRDAAQLVRAIIATHDEQARTAHDIAAGTDRDRCPTASLGARPPRPHSADAASRLPRVLLKAPAAVGRSPTEHRPTPTPIARLQPRLVAQHLADLAGALGEFLSGE